MVMFYDEYSTETFTTIVNKYLDAEFVQPMAAQIEVKQLVSKSKAIQSKNGAAAFVQPLAAQIEDMFKVQINLRNSPLLDNPVADSTLSAIVIHTHLI